MKTTTHQLYEVLDRFGRIVYARCSKSEAEWRAKKIGGSVRPYTAQG